MKYVAFLNNGVVAETHSASTVEAALAEINRFTVLYQHAGENPIECKNRFRHYTAEIREG